MAAGSTRHIEPLLPTAAAAASTYIVWAVRQPRRPRGLPVRRGAIRQVVPPQQNPPFPFSEIKQPRRPRGLLRFRRASDEVVPPQFNPPFPFSEIKQPRQPRGASRRRGRGADEPLSVFVPPYPSWAPTRQAGPRRALRRPKRPPVETVTPQQNPPFPFSEIKQPRQPRGMLARRSRIKTETTPKRRRFFPKTRWF